MKMMCLKGKAFEREEETGNHLDCVEFNRTRDLLGSEGVRENDGLQLNADWPNQGARKSSPSSSI